MYTMCLERFNSVIVLVKRCSTLDIFSTRFRLQIRKHINSRLLVSAYVLDTRCRLYLPHLCRRIAALERARCSFLQTKQVLRVFLSPRTPLLIRLRDRNKRLLSFNDLNFP